MGTLASSQLHLGIAGHSCVNEVVMSYFHFAGRAVECASGIGHSVVSCYPFERLFHSHADMIVIIGIVRSPSRCSRFWTMTSTGVPINTAPAHLKLLLILSASDFKMSTQEQACAGREHRAQRAIMASNRNEILAHHNTGRVRDRIADESKPGKDEWRAVFLVPREKPALKDSP